MTVLAARGFVASGLAAGIKGDGRLDLALVACERPGVVPTAGVFTSNRFAAAPVQVSRAHIAQDQGMSAGVVLNSGCANAASGAQGLRAAELTCEVAARELKVRPCEVLVCSTGTIGTPLEVDKIAAALPTLVASRGSSPECSQAAAQAILTTDTRTKQVVVEGEGFRVGAMAKGAAMLSPNMATMLAVLTTDATATPTVLRGALGGAVGSSFNEMTVDGCTSTNDTVIAMASCLGPEVSEAALGEALGEACRELALQMVADAEGGTKVVRVRVLGAVDSESARKAARQVAESSLVKSSWYGQDANWGRVLSELGCSGTPLEPDRVSIAYGDVTVCRGGVGVDHDQDALAKTLACSHFEITCDLALGTGAATIVAADLTPAYVELNMGRS